MPEGELTIDKNTFKALSKDVRIDIIKLLTQRRMTQAEISKTLGFNESSISRHLDELESAELVTQNDDGRKWKYYELTQKGRRLGEPPPANGNLYKMVLAIALLALLAAIAYLYSSTGGAQPIKGIEGLLGQQNPTPIIMITPGNTTTNQTTTTTSSTSTSSSTQQTHATIQGPPFYNPPQPTTTTTQAQANSNSTGTTTSTTSSSTTTTTQNQGNDTGTTTTTTTSSTTLQQSSTTTTTTQPTTSTSSTTTTTSSSSSTTTTQGNSTFSLQISPSAVTIPQNGIAYVGASVTLTGGSPVAVNLSDYPCPAAAACTFYPAIGTASFFANFTVTAGNSTPPGTYEIGVLAASGSMTENATLSLKVT